MVKYREARLFIVWGQWPSGPHHMGLTFAVRESCFRMARRLSSRLVPRLRDVVILLLGSFVDGPGAPCAMGVVCYLICTAALRDTPCPKRDSLSVNAAVSRP